jgi:hypothetical protein
VTTDELCDLVSHDILYVPHNIVVWVLDLSKDKHLCPSQTQLREREDAL